MKCGNKGIDTHGAILNQACGIFYMPNDTGSDKPCKFFGKCQNWIEKVIREDEEPRELHRQYKSEVRCD